MFELIENKPAVDVQESEYRRLLGYPKNRPIVGRARELADAARKWFLENGRPWVFAHEMNSLEVRDQTLRLDGMEFSSKRLREVFSEAAAHGAMLVAVSAGKECEEHARQLWCDEKPDEYFFLESFGSAVVEHLVTVASGRICGWADENKLAVLPHLSPGYSGWDIAEQVNLWNLLRRQSGGFPGELEVLESGMLRPKKSQLAVFGLTRDLARARQFANLVPCETCSLPNCRYRRAAYKRFRLPLENVQRESMAAGRRNPVAE
jgi:hypothetical protein